MAVIAVLVAVAIPTFGSQLEKARQATDRANLRDAYASAKLAIQTSDEATGTIRSALAAGSVTAADYDNKTYCFWYKADGDNDGWTYVGTSDAVTDSTPTAAKALLLKAATANNLDVNALPTSITYVARPSAVTTDAGILIQVAYNKSTNVFTLNGIGFSTDGKTLKGALTAENVTVTVADNTVTTPPMFTVKLDGTDVTDYEVSSSDTNLALLGLKIEGGAVVSLYADAAAATAASFTAPATTTSATVTFTHTSSGRMTTATITFTVT